MQTNAARLGAVDRHRAEIRHDWQLEEVQALFGQPFNDLIHAAQQIHRRHFDPNEVQVSSLLSIKTGACSEDCAYCPQSVHHDTGLARESAAVERCAAGASDRRRTREPPAAWGPPGGARGIGT